MKNYAHTIIGTLGLALLTLTATQLPASELREHNAIERLGVVLKDLEICHQKDWRNLSVDLQYQTDGIALSGPAVQSHIREFLEAYSEPADFWEVMNTKLVHSLVETFPQITAIESRLSLQPDNSLSFPRVSTVEYTKGSDVLKEAFSFKKLDYLICQDTFQSLDMQVAFDLWDNPVPADYPDYQWVDEAMEAFFAKHPVSFNSWSKLKPILEAHLLETFPSMTTIDIEVTIAK